MPPVPVYTSSPITAAVKPSSVTPQTATPDDAQPDQPAEKSRPIPTPTPTRTTHLHGGPPPPQPGAVPRLPTATATATAPPPPSASTNYPPQQAPEPTAAPNYLGISQPPQMGIPAPGMSYGQSQRGTTTATTGSPGYQQNSGLDQYQSAQARNDSYRGGAEAEEDEGVWGSAVKWAQAAGKKLSEAETEVWKRINKE